MNAMRILMSATCLAMGAAQAQVAELRAILKGDPSTPALERYLEIAEKGDAETRLLAACNIDKLRDRFYSYVGVEAGKRVGAFFVQELGARRDKVEVKLLLRTGIRIVGSQTLPKFQMDSVCGNEVGGAGFVLSDMVLPALQNRNRELSDMMAEDCIQACNIAMLILRESSPDRARAGLRPWLKSKHDSHRIGATAAYLWFASTEEDGALMKPVLEKLDFTDADYAHSRLMSRPFSKIYPTVMSIPAPLRVIHIARQPDSGLPRPRAEEFIEYAKPLNAEHRVFLFKCLSDNPRAALEFYRAYASDIQTESTPFEFKVDPLQIERYFPLIDEMLESKNWAVRTTAGRIAMQSLDHGRASNERVAQRYVMRLLKDPHPDVRATTRAAVTVLRGPLQDEIRRVLAKDGVDLPPPRKQG